MITAEQAQDAVLMLCDGATINLNEDLGGQRRFTLSDGRRYLVELATGSVTGISFDGVEALAILGTQQGTGFDSATALDLIKTRTGATTDTEATRRALAVVKHYLEQV
jgi:hypothetical protein